MCKYLSDIKKDINRVIYNSYLDRVLIKSNAGSGKSTFICNMAKERDVCIIVPYNSILFAYDNIPVLSNTVEVVHSNSTIKSIPYRGSVIVNFDNAVKYWDDIVSRYDTIVLDESHTLFTDIEFRDINYKLYKLLCHFEGKLIGITATPVNEAASLGLHIIDESSYSFMKGLNKLDVCYKWGLTKKVLSAVEWIIEDFGDKYDYIMVFDNEIGSQICQKWTLKGLDYNYFKSDTIKSGVCKEDLDNERLSKKYNVGTTCIMAGCNFRNEGKVMTIHVAREGKTIYNEIEQSVSRFRNAHVDAFVLGDMNTVGSYKNNDIEGVVDRKLWELMFNNMMNQYKIVEDDEKWNDVGYITFISKLFDYRMFNARFDILKNQLKKTYKLDEAHCIDNFLDTVKRSKLKRDTSNRYKASKLHDREMIYMNDYGVIEKLWVEKWDGEERRLIKTFDDKDILKKIFSCNISNKYTVEGVFRILKSIFKYIDLTNLDIDILERELKEKIEVELSNMKCDLKKKDKMRSFMEYNMNAELLTLKKAKTLNAELGDITNPTIFKSNTQKIVCSLFETVEDDKVKHIKKSISKK